VAHVLGLENTSACSTAARTLHFLEGIPDHLVPVGVFRRTDKDGDDAAMDIENELGVSRVSLVRILEGS
jgi:hypothetical protein